MCNSRNSARIPVLAYRGEIRVDKCMKYLIEFLWRTMDGFDSPVACCCGHGRYPMTVVVSKEGVGNVEIISGTKIPRSKRFYRKDKNGYYYIPELIGGTKT